MYMQNIYIYIYMQKKKQVLHKYCTSSCSCSSIGREED